MVDGGEDAEWRHEMGRPSPTAYLGGVAAPLGGTSRVRLGHVLEDGALLRGKSEGPASPRKTPSSPVVGFGWTGQPVVATWSCAGSRGCSTVPGCATVIGLVRREDIHGQVRTCLQRAWRACWLATNP